MRSSRILALGSAIIICVFLAACGGGGGGSTPPPATPLSITSSVLTQATVNVPYSFYLQGTGGQGTYSWGISSGSLPPGLGLDGGTGQLHGIPTAAGSYQFTAKVTDSSLTNATANLTLMVSGAIIIKCNSCSAGTAQLPSGTPNVPYTGTLSATGGVSPYTWCVVEANNGACDDGSAGALPAGLTLNSMTGVISGTPTTPQAPMQFTVEVTDSEDPASSAMAQFSISIFGLTSMSLASGEIYVPYSQQMEVAGGRAPYTWCVMESGGHCDNGSGGALPAGITIAATCTNDQQTICTISGTPSQSGSFPFTIKITDSETPAAVATAQLNLDIAGITNSLLKGNYVMSLTGFKSGNPYVLVSAFVTDGNGNITNGFLDLNDGSGETINNGHVIPQTLTTGSAYNLNSNGTGTVTLVTSTDTYNFSIVASATACLAAVNMSNCARIIQRDSGHPQMYGAGVLQAQDGNFFPANQFFPGSFALQAVGTTPSGSRYAAAGSLAFNPNTLIDIDCSGWGLASCPLDQDSAGTAAYNPIKGSFSSTVDQMTGRGDFALLSFPADPNNICLGTLSSFACTYAFYIVNKEEMILISANPVSKPANLTLWTAYRQLSNAGGWTLSSLTGNSVAELSALNPSGAKPDISAGLLSSNGSGSGTLTTDENVSGTLHTQQSSQGTYAIDATGQKTGKVTLTGFDTQFGSNPPILYLFGSNTAVVVGTDAKVTSGILEPQMGSSFTNSSVRGAYAGGSTAPTKTTVTNSVTFLYADGVGTLSGPQYTSGPSGPGGPHNLALTYTVNSTGRTVVKQGSNTYGYLYVVSPRKFVLLPVGSDPTLGVFFIGETQ